MLGAEKAAASAGRGKSMVKLLDDMRADKKRNTGAHWTPPTRSGTVFESGHLTK